ncbi:MAG TPA: TatA/E family twin arginine-targeting protein translocase [Thermosynechococcaceae cyanobacterium]
MNIFGIGLPEMAVIMVLALLVFGPKKLPEIGRSLGKTIRSFQNATKDFEEEFKREADQLEQPAKAPMEAILEPSPVLSPAEVPKPVAEVPEAVEPATVRDSGGPAIEEAKVSS